MSTTETKMAVSSRSGIFAECAVWLALAAGMWLYSYDFDVALSTYALGPVAWPRAIMLIIVVAAIGGLMADLRRRRDGNELVTDASSDGDAGGILDGAARVRLAAAILLPLLYLWLLPRAGYFATTPFFLAAYMIVLGIRSWRTVTLTTAVTYGLLLFLFSKLLYIPLPTGVWPGFYDFSNWLLVFLRG
ncbi:MAG: tripartite tricarboxylate transporter TctB family protein [Alphaproteobacteria bacterium]|nr:tripartite tricarboxylate transporter TctB family protein [Alphaproteobacteria bacterium]